MKTLLVDHCVHLFLFSRLTKASVGPSVSPPRIIGKVKRRPASVPKNRQCVKDPLIRGLINARGSQSKEVGMTAFQEGNLCQEKKISRKHVTSEVD